MVQPQVTSSPTRNRGKATPLHRPKVPTPRPHKCDKSLVVSCDATVAEPHLSQKWVTGRRWGGPGLTLCRGFFQSEQPETDTVFCPRFVRCKGLNSPLKTWQTAVFSGCGEPTGSPTGQTPRAQGAEMLSPPSGHDTCADEHTHTCAHTHTPVRAHTHPRTHPGARREGAGCSEDAPV